MNRFATRAVNDSFALLRDMQSGSVDVIITDPPYAEHTQSNMCSGSLVGKKSVPKYELPFNPLTQYDWLKDCLRIATRWVVVFCSVEDFGHFLDAVGRPEYVRSCIWYKSNAMGQLTADRPASSYEGIAVMHRADVKKAWNGRGSYGVWRCNGTRGKRIDTLTKSLSTWLLSSPLFFLIVMKPFLIHFAVRAQLARPLFVLGAIISDLIKTLFGVPGPSKGCVMHRHP